MPLTRADTSVESMTFLSLCCQSERGGKTARCRGVPASSRKCARAARGPKQLSSSWGYLRPSHRVILIRSFASDQPRWLWRSTSPPVWSSSTSVVPAWSSCGQASPALSNACESPGPTSRPWSGSLLVATSVPEVSTLASGSLLRVLRDADVYPAHEQHRPALCLRRRSPRGLHRSASKRTKPASC